MTRVDEYMSWPIHVVDVKASVGDAADRMTATQVSRLLVIESGRLRGVVCACDIEPASREAPLHSFVSSPVLTLLPTATMDDAAILMEEAGVGCLPVVAHGQVVGILTRADLARGGVRSKAALACSSCGRHSHVEEDPRGSGVPFCVDCIEAAELPDAELGGGD
jgi:predicted transcriptional regulator